MHCSFDDGWAAPLGGSRALARVLRHPLLPTPFFFAWGPPAVRSLLWVLRVLPAHSAGLHSEVAGLLHELLDRTVEQVPGSIQFCAVRGSFC